MFIFQLFSGRPMRLNGLIFYIIFITLSIYFKR